MDKKAEYLRIGKYLVISDLHIGIELEYEKRGIFIPWQVNSLIEKIKGILEREKKIKSLIINGDIKHNILRPPKIELKFLYRFLEEIKELFDEIIIIKGNHDGKLERIIPDIPIRPWMIYRKNLLIHGHRRVRGNEGSFKKIITGHLHPIFVSKGRAIKVFILGKYKDWTTIILPAFSDLCGGKDIRKEVYGVIARHLEDIKIVSLDGKILYHLLSPLEKENITQ